MPRLTKEALRALAPECDAFVGLDSDGCVFDTMEAKQCGFFHPRIVEFWNLGALEAALRETAEFVNLRSAWRGSNRYVALLRTFEWFSRRPDVRASGVALPETRALDAYVRSGAALGEPTLEVEVVRTGDESLRRVLEWSRAVNRDVAERMGDLPPFLGVRECLDSLRGRADVVVVSQTPEEALLREWTRSGLAGSVRAIAGQELGTKAQHLALAASGRYATDRILLVGDAPGDWQAAREAKALFFPILPGEEPASWEHLRREGLDRFFGGTFAGEYQEQRVREFLDRLPDHPPWRVE
jgi:phosphoglycolate phosphatase-like HAD superfamily hydrolase